MKPVHYVILNPSGNLTALVTDHGGPEDEKEIVTSLMRESEQVAFLEPPMEPGALARIRLMGGEFCGNAAMAAAGWLTGYDGSDRRLRRAGHCVLQNPRTGNRI